MVQKVKNDKNRDDSLLFSRAQFIVSHRTLYVHTSDTTRPIHVRRGQKQ